MKALSLAAVLFAGAALAAGFAIDTHGGRATGMGTAVTAQIDDASAVYYNPAGIAQGKRIDVMLGDTLIAPNVSVAGPSGSSTSTTSGVAPPPHLYLTYGVLDSVSLGLGVFSSFGASSKWPADWEGRQRTLGSSVQTFNINPEVAVRAGDKLRFGVGFQIVRATVLLERGTNFVDSDGTVALGGGSWGNGFNFGAQYAIWDELRIGASYRSDVTLKFDGNAHFTNVPPELGTKLKDQGVKTSLKLPEIFGFGVSYKPIPKLVVAADVNYYRWSSVQSIDLAFEDSQLNSSLAKNWSDTANFHLGGEYSVTDAIHARLGFVYDPTPSPTDTLTPDLPDANRIKIALGAGYRMDKFAFDLGYQYVMLNSTTSTSAFFPATYSGSAHVLGLTLSYRD